MAPRLAEQFNKGGAGPKALVLGSLILLERRRGRVARGGASAPSKRGARCARPLRGGEFLRGGVPPFARRRVHRAVSSPAASAASTPGACAWRGPHASPSGFARRQAPCRSDS